MRAAVIGIIMAANHLFQPKHQAALLFNLANKILAVLIIAHRITTPILPAFGKFSELFPAIICRIG